MITFTNLNTSPMTVSTPRWQRDVIRNIENKYQEEARDCDAKYRAAVIEALESSHEGNTAWALDKVMQNSPRYSYITDVEAPDGKHYDVEIDLLLHGVRFTEL